MEDLLSLISNVEGLMTQLLNPTSVAIKDDEVTGSLVTELPIADYQDLPAEELFDRIVTAKKNLGDQVLILGHILTLILKEKIRSCAYWIFHIKKLRDFNLAFSDIFAIYFWGGR